MAILVYSLNQKMKILPDKALLGLVAVGFIISVYLLIHVVHKFGPTEGVAYANADGCAEQLTGWVFANSLISCLALLNVWLNSYR